jgi:hypothetical protein
MYNIAGDPDDVLASLQDFSMSWHADFVASIRDRAPLDPLARVWKFKEPIYGTTGYLTPYALSRLLHVGRSYIKEVDPELIAAALNRTTRREAARVHLPGRQGHN